MTTPIQTLPPNFQFSSKLLGLNTVYVCEENASVFFEFDTPEALTLAAKAAKKSWDLVRLQIGSPKGSSYCAGYGINPDPQDLCITSAGLEMRSMNPKPTHIDSIEKLIEKTAYWMSTHYTSGQLHSVKVVQIHAEELIER